MGTSEEPLETLDKLFGASYEECRRLARRLMKPEPAGHTWSPTDLVHVVYIKLRREERFACCDDRQFIRVVRGHGPQDLAMGWIVQPLDRLFGGLAKDLTHLESPICADDHPHVPVAAAVAARRKHAQKTHCAVTHNVFSHQDISSGEPR